MKKFQKLVLLCTLLAVVAFVPACKQENKIIDKVVIQPSEDLTKLNLSLVFTPSVQTNFMGQFQINKYGYLFMKPYDASTTPATPFEIGFNLDTNIVNEQEYVHIQPTLYLPNGVPIGVGYPLVELKKPTPISPRYDLQAYVDVLHGVWVGAGASITAMDVNSIPAGIALTQVFLRNEQGQPGIVAMVYGPSAKPDGSLDKPGGIALFANFKQVQSSGLIGLKQPATLFADKQPQASGKDAHRIGPREMKKIESGILRALNNR